MSAPLTDGSEFPQPDAAVGQQAPQPPQVVTHVHVDTGKKVNHVLHLILTIVTAGLWLPVWAIIAIKNS